MGYWEAGGKSDEWFTPPYIFDALGCVFDMDVAAPADGGDHVPATERLTGGALGLPWNGFIWMNPPFGGRNGIAPWLGRFIEHGNGIALTPDRTSAPWFQDYAPRMDVIVFTKKIRFLRPDGSEGKSPSNGTALMGKGPIATKVLMEAGRRGLGVTVLPMEAV